MDDICIPRATYRLQFQRGFGFDDAADLAPYLARLGVSHIYASPYVKARPGSTHGYDVLDHNCLNPELGDQAAFDRMVAALRANGLGQILDFVSNHMGVGGADNPLWLNVLEWGPDSRYAGWFDIDWDPDRRYLRNKLLIPFLGDQYGIELERGNLELKFDPDDGSFAVWAYGIHKLPICPLHYQQILGDSHPALERIGDTFAGLPRWRPQVERRAAELKAQLATLAREDSGARRNIDASVACFNRKDDTAWKPLHRLIEAQYWRAAHFRVAADDINYRRFFNINDLAGMRMELPELFDHAHRLLFRLLGDGILAGIRIDHVDGLMEPLEYLHRLRKKAPRRNFYLLLEKILARNESLPEDWPVDGTTGYDFANLVLGLLIDPAAEETFTRAYSEFTGITAGFSDIVRDSKLRIMDNEMASELNVLARDAGRLARSNPHTADFTRNILARALREIIACFPVYRSYVDASGKISDADRDNIDRAIAQAQRRTPELDPSVFAFLHELLTGDLVAQPRNGFSRSAALRCAMKFQQYSGPVMAKGMEDTAFYRYNRFVALNEVGGLPEMFGIGLSAFHAANSERAQRWPGAMNATATHDTKRGEDTRARLAVLSEIPEQWTGHVQCWSRQLRARRGDGDATALPDRNDEYLFYQLLVGTWPAGMLGAISNRSAFRAYSDRMAATMIKSVREAKVCSTWTAPNLAYEEAILSFVADALDPARAGTFLASIVPFVAEIARLGANNTIAQTVLKLTLPGVPDIYQGTELWDLSMVDPDNRRPVDYKLRAQMIEDVCSELSAGRRSAMQRYLDSWQDGRFKLAIIASLLDCRRERESLFRKGSYGASEANGPGADQVCAYVRRLGSEALLCAVARFPARTAKAGFDPALRINVPLEFHSVRWRDVLSGKEYDAAQILCARELFADLPAAVLTAM